MEMEKSISRQTLLRLPRYLNYLKGLSDDGAQYISAAAIAETLHLNHVVVRKDLGVVSGSGRPKVGYVRTELVHELETILGYDKTDEAVLVGVGKMGQALLAYEGFRHYGLNIVAAFEIDPRLIGTEVSGCKVLPLEKVSDLCARMGVHMGIIAVPGTGAQEVCNLLVDGGVKAIWNFANVYLDVPDDILVQNEDMALSLAILSNHLKERFSTKKIK